MSKHNRGSQVLQQPVAAPPAVAQAAFPDVFARMYGQWTMDGAIIETTLAVAGDFVDRPNYFTQVPEAVAQLLANLWYRTGTHPEIPGQMQRAAICRAVFGACECAKAEERSSPSDFQIARDAVLDVAVRYTKRTFDEGRESLFRAFRDRMITLREYLTTLAGASLRAGFNQTSSVFTMCVLVLQNDEVARGYGLPPAPNAAGWPLAGVYSGQGAQLIESITKKLNAPEAGVITRQQVLALQRVAYDGGRIVAAAADQGVNLDDRPTVDALIQIAFTWWTALQDLKPKGGEAQLPNDGESKGVLSDASATRTSLRSSRSSVLTA